MGINREAGKALSWEHGSAILETIPKVPIVSCHCAVIRALLWGLVPQHTERHLGVSSLAYQGLSWGRLYLSCGVASQGLAYEAYISGGNLCIVFQVT